MNPLQLNAATGFLEPTHSRPNALDADKKLQLIQAITEQAEAGKWPGIHRLCKSLGIPPSTFYEHLEVDANFKQAYEEALLALEDHCVDNLVRQGNSLNGVTANIFLLKNRWGKRWNENYNVNFHGEVGQLKGLIAQSEAFIDAEVVNTSTPPTAIPDISKRVSLDDK